MHRRGRESTYDKRPCVQVGTDHDVVIGWRDIAERLRADGVRVIVVDAYVGVRDEDIRELVDALQPDLIIDAAAALRPPAAIQSLVAPDLTDDPVFGRLTHLELSDFFDPARLGELRRETAESTGTLLVHGVGAALVTRGDRLLYADLPRWEIQQRQRRGEVGNLGVDNRRESASLKYKRGYFVDWRVCDRHKRGLFGDVDAFLDTSDADSPKLVDGRAMRDALHDAARRPLRLVPLFDPAPWGGQWMKEVCDLPRDAPNYGWCFDCVPEENSLLFAFGANMVEVPAVNLVFEQAQALLGTRIRRRFGDEFPIRFDFLDTIGGGNLSLQVHPLTEYMRSHFGVHYTQDESYYMLDTDEGACVRLGLKSGVDPAAMIADLRRAQSDGVEFPVDAYVNRFPAKRHDHFLIPAGTVHCSGANTMVLEISATPYIFTFKLWDWNRLGLDGHPRPLHIDHGSNNIRFERDTGFVERNLINRVTALGEGDGWKAERTGLHEAEFIETHRHWFTAPVTHDTGGGVNVVNLVEGEQVLVESPRGEFAPLSVHYAETFIVPACVGAYTIKPYGKSSERRHATIKAFVR
jgi:mannose-6-phosphate isomerase class I